MWEVRKKILNGDNLVNLSLSPRPEIWSLSLGLGGSVLVSWVAKFAHSHNKGKLREGHVNYNDMHSNDVVCSSAHTCWCVVDGSVARTAY